VRRLTKVGEPGASPLNEAYKRTAENEGRGAVRSRTELIALAFAISGGVGAVALAQGDPVKTRKDIMKRAGDVTKEAAAMVRERTSFDLAKAKETFAVYEDAGKRMPELFPDSSKPSPQSVAALKSGEYISSPKIWDEKPKFLPGFEKLQNDARAAQGEVTDLVSFRAAFTRTTKNCETCHENYRIKKD
jgi:cytochrome c556